MRPIARLSFTHAPMRWLICQPATEARSDFPICSKRSMGSAKAVEWETSRTFAPLARCRNSSTIW